MFEKLLTSDSSYVIAEVGQNHQGEIDLALQYVESFASNGADAIKFQMRDNRFLFSAEKYNQPYNSENSFGHTYGEHREHLELSDDDFLLIKDKCEALNVDLMITPFDEPSLERTFKLGVDCIKAASFDMGNISFLSLMAETKLPLVVSCGGSSLDIVASSIIEISKHHNNFAVMHCVSEYPCPFNRLALGQLLIMQERFPGVTLGLSDHFNGTLSGPLSYMLGARVFEKHVTFCRAWKGTDHAFSLEPDGFRRFVRDIRRVPSMLQGLDSGALGNEPVFSKLGKSIVATRDLSAGHAIGKADITGKILMETAIAVRDSSKVIGSILVKPIKKGSVIRHEDIES